ncbi:MAG: DUF3102 domain-containing protein [Thermoanaerobaculia bacterium]
MTGTDLTPRGVTELATIATAIRDEHEAAQAAFTSAVEHAIRCGELLIEAKSKVGHGGWGDWITEHFPASWRTAQSYIQLANRAEDARRVAHLGVRGTLKQLAAPREEVDQEDRLAGARQYITQAEDCYRGAFEEFAAAGIRFTPTGLELPDDLPFEQWQEIGKFIASLIPEAEGGAGP